MQRANGSSGSAVSSLSSDESDFELENIYPSGRIPRDGTRRAHHNALERRRRDAMASSFEMLQSTVPAVARRRASRHQILNSASKYIRQMKDKRTLQEEEMMFFAKNNDALELKARVLECKLGIPHRNLNEPLTDESESEIGTEEDVELEEAIAVASKKRKL